MYFFGYMSPHTFLSPTFRFVLRFFTTLRMNFFSKSFARCSSEYNVSIKSRKGNTMNGLWKRQTYHLNWYTILITFKNEVLYAKYQLYNKLYIILCYALTMIVGWHSYTKHNGNGKFSSKFIQSHFKNT